MINRIRWQLLLALFWFVSAYLAIGAILPWEWAWRCAWLNVIIGMVGLLLATRTDKGDQLFYEGPRSDEPGLFQIGLLWAIPLIGLMVAGLWWLLRLLEIFDW